MEYKAIYFKQTPPISMPSTTFYFRNLRSIANRKDSEELLYIIVVQFQQAVSYICRFVRNKSEA